MPIQKESIINLDNVGPAQSRKKRRARIITILALAALGALVFLFFRFQISAEGVSLKSYTTASVSLGELVSTTEASGTVVIPAQVTIVSSADGYVEELLVEEGERITPSDILATLEVPDLEDAYEELTLSREQAQIELETITADYDFLLRDTRLKLERLADDIAEAEEDVQNLKELSGLKSSRQSDFETAQEVLEELREQREDLQYSLEETLVKKDLALRKQQAALAQIRSSLQTTREDIEDTRIKSPIAGEVLSINEDLSIPGSVINKADSLFIVADRDQPFIDFDVYEQYANRLTLGGEMTVTVGSDTMKAQIVKIGKIASMDSDGLSAMISVRAKPLTEETLTPGASAVASITLGVEENALLLPRGSYLTTGSQKWVYKVEGDSAVKTKVTFGSIEGTKVEVLSGLQAGDEIITSSYQNYIDEDVIILE